MLTKDEARRRGQRGKAAEAAPQEKFSAAAQAAIV
jgi:hypothetical protein